MRLSALRQCDGCRGPVLAPPANRFYVIRVQAAVIDHIVAGEVLGLEASTHDLALAEAMVEKPEAAVRFTGDDHEHNLTELHLCGGCYGRSTIERLVHGAAEARRSA